MSKSYYEASRDILIKKLDCLRNRRYVDFFRQSDEFELAIGLSYFALAEELLVEKDSRNLDIATRFTKHVDDSRLRSLITDDIIIHDKEDDGNSPEWFLVALRNGIIHNGFTVDYENRRVNVVNNGAANKLDCSVSFDWFKKFLMDDLLLNRTFDNYKYTVVLNPFVKVEDATHMSSFDDVRNFIENELPAYDIEIFFDDTHSDKNKIGREEFTLFCGDRQTLFWRLQNTPEELTKEELDRLEKHKSIVEGELADIKGSLSEAEYYKRYYSKLFNYWFTEEFKVEYPNYNIKISDFSRKSPRLNMVVSGMNNDELEKQGKEKAILFVDYLQYLQGNPREDSQTLIKRIQRELKKYTIENDSLVILLIANSRDADTEGKKSSISGGRDSSDIEYSSEYNLQLNFTEWERGEREHYTSRTELKRQNPNTTMF